MSRLLTVSNRLPWTVQVSAGRAELVPASGGLASGLLPEHRRRGGRWIGWPGEASHHGAGFNADIDAHFAANGIVPVQLTSRQVDRFYHGFSNRVLWPLFHYLVDRVPVDAAGWEAYQDVNRTFCDVVRAEYRDGDLIWVHDYQLLLLPAMLRAALPDAKIGFFLHIPFPSSEVFRTLPWRDQLVDGLLGADMVGFHTSSYLRHFMSALTHREGVEVDIDRVRLRERNVRLGVFPMGVDAATFTCAAESPSVVAAAEEIRREAGDRAIIVGVDRLDYTKGIPRRLAAIERLLTRAPELRDTVRYIQIAVPSREQVDSYQRFRREVEERIGRINGNLATVRSTPIHYVHQSIDFDRLVALYRAADVMVVTPLRDGMNLVAKEFVASRPDGNGALVLSEFAGAASELDGALLVNPYDIDAVASSLQQALAMPIHERQRRMQIMRRRVAHYDVHHWAEHFLETLEDSREQAATPDDVVTESLVAELRSAREGELRLLLDYDGTLVPFAATPDQASPDAELMRLLHDLSASEDVHLHIVSGRPRETLERWFGDLPISLWAEHGFWSRLEGDVWRSGAEVQAGWLDRVRPILEHFTASTPGSFIETKPASVAWHYRGAAGEFGESQAHELRLLLDESLRQQPFEVLRGRKVLEVRRRNISKATVAEHLRRTGSSGTIVAIGDDHTDEDLFRALPPDSITIGVGERATRARFALRNYRDVRRLLATLVTVRSSPLLATLVASQAVSLIN